jgi:hypothetical protein
MLRSAVTTYTRLRALAYTALGVVFSALLTVVTVRFALEGGRFEILLLVALTIGMWIQTLRWFRRFRQAGQDQASVRHN